MEIIDRRKENTFRRATVAGIFGESVNQGIEMASFSIHKSMAVAGISSERVIERLQEQVNVSFASVRVKRRLDDGLEFTAKPKGNPEFGINALVRFKLRKNTADVKVDATVGLSGIGVLIVSVGFLGFMIVGIGIAIYYGCVYEKIARSAFTQLLDSLEFDLS